MSRHIEPLNGGVWSALDPALLKPGQLSAGRNFVYLAGSPAIYRAWGREVFGAASASAVDVNGLRDAQFDGGDHILIALASASYLTATVGDTGTFGVLASGLPGVGSQLEAVQYRNRFFLMPGLTTTVGSAVGTNGCLYVSATGTGIPATVRQHGMAPVKTPPVVSTASGTFSQTVTGYYEYWTTEVANIQTDGVRLALESTFEPPTTTQWVSATSVVPVVQMPQIVNPITTHWRIYRSAKKDLASDTLFPAGYMIAELPATGASAVSAVGDTFLVSSTPLYPPTSANGVGNSATYFVGWVNPSAAYVDDGVYASASAATVFTPRQQGYFGFNFGGLGGAVKGVEVMVQAYVSSGTGPVPLSVFIAPNRQSTGNYQKVGPFHLPRIAGKSVMISATASASPQTVVVGSSADAWFAKDYWYPLGPTDFDGNFMVVLGLGNAGSAIGVDYVNARAWYAATFDSTVQFPTVVYTVGDEVAQVGKNGPPPSSNTGAVFLDSLVTNDLSDPSLIRYSYPGSPEAFPSTYYLNFETRENDAVKCIKVVNNRLIVGLQSSLWRVNYLPSEMDANFDRGKAMECISRDYGIVNPMCACTFTPDGPSELLAFVSNQGIHYTDGYTFNTLTDGIDWRANCLSTAATSTPIALINDKENQILRFYYRNDDISPAIETYMCLPLSYGAGHWVNGQSKVGGMIHMRNFAGAGTGTGYAALRSAWQVENASGGVDFLFGYGGDLGVTLSAGAGKVYRESGTNIRSNSSDLQFTTRRMYLAGLSKEFRLNEVYGYAGNYTGTPLVTYTALNAKTNDDAEATVGVKSLTLAGGPLHKVQFNQMCEGLRLSFDSTTVSGYRQEALILDGENFGLEDSGL